jgi:DNA sulfur modification protein DndB
MAKALQKEMYSAPMYEVEKFVKSEHDMSLDNFATLSAIRGLQFGREMFTSMLKFKDMLDFLEVFETVQRNANKRKITKIKNYVLSGLSEDKPLRFFSSLTVTCRGGMFYDQNTHKVAINTKDSKLSVNDGQHRFFGVSEAIRELQGRYNTEKDEQKQEYYLIKLNELKNMVIPIVIYNGIDEQEEKQLFHDMNVLAQRPSRSATIKLAQTDRLSSMARELAEENRYLKHYGVEMDKMSIHGEKNTNTILLTTVYSMIKIMFGKGYKSPTSVASFFTEENYTYYKKTANKILDLLFSALPHDLDKTTYVLNKSYGLKGVARFYYEAKEMYHVNDDQIREVLENTDFSLNYDHWKQYGASLSKNNNIIFTNHLGIMAVYKTLMENLEKVKPDLFNQPEE